MDRAPIDLRVVTYNLWHGGWLRGRRESAATKRARHAQQLAEIAQLAPDVLLLQEVSPVPELTHWFADELAMQAVWAIDNGGLHVALPARRSIHPRRVGLPGDFLNGLAILARPELQLNGLGRVRLSGPAPLHTSRFAAQLGETRFGLGATLQLGERGTLLLCNTHLHAPRNLTATPSAPLAGAARRLHEATRCVRALAAWKSRLERTGPPIAGTLLAGDLNDLPDSAPLRHLLDSGLIDSGDRTPAAQESTTWCPQVSAQLLAGCMMSPRSLLVRAFARRHDPASDARLQAARRIDYILTCPTLAATVKRAEPFIPHGTTARALSDHTGWVVEFCA